MSIFTEKDKDLPLLTQVYQLDRPKAGKPSPPDHPDLDQWVDMLAAENEPPAEREAQVQRLLPIVALAKSIMDSVCSAGVVSEKDIVQLNKFLRLYQTAPTYQWQKSGGGGGIPVGSLSLTGVAATENEMEYLIIKAVKSALNSAQVTPGYFQQCKACQSVYLRDNVRQIYCSPGCKNRAGVQRFYNNTHKPIGFQRCEQCESVFLVERKDQLYCSKRCSNRARNKRFHNKSEAERTGAADWEALARERMAEWSPSDAELAGAMEAIEANPESGKEFKERLFRSVIDDIDGIYPAKAGAGLITRPGSDHFNGLVDAYLPISAFVKG